MMRDKDWIVETWTSIDRVGKYRFKGSEKAVIAWAREFNPKLRVRVIDEFAGLTMWVQ